MHMHNSVKEAGGDVLHRVTEETEKIQREYWKYVHIGQQRKAKETAREKSFNDLTR